MPQLDVVTYLTQYIWTLIILFFLFSLLVNIILPRLQEQLTIRVRLSNAEPDSLRGKGMTKLETLKTLFQLK